jgi:hypothetical protein
MAASPARETVLGNGIAAITALIGEAERVYQRLRHRYEFRQRGMINIKGKAPMNCYLLMVTRAGPTVPAAPNPDECQGFSHARIVVD